MKRWSLARTVARLGAGLASPVLSRPAGRRALSTTAVRMRPYDERGRGKVLQPKTKTKTKTFIYLETDRLFILLSFRTSPELHANRLPPTHEDHVPAHSAPRTHLPVAVHPPAAPHAITLLSHVVGERSTPLISKPIGTVGDGNPKACSDL